MSVCHKMKHAFFVGKIIIEALLASGTSTVSLLCSSCFTVNRHQFLWRDLGSCVGWSTTKHTGSHLFKYAGYELSVKIKIILPMLLLKNTKFLKLDYAKFVQILVKCQY